MLSPEEYHLHYQDLPWGLLSRGACMKSPVEFQGPAYSGNLLRDTPVEFHCRTAQQRIIIHRQPSAAVLLHRPTGVGGDNRRLAVVLFARRHLAEIIRCRQSGRNSASHISRHQSRLPEPCADQQTQAHEHNEHSQRQGHRTRHWGLEAVHPKDKNDPRDLPHQQEQAV